MRKPTSWISSDHHLFHKNIIKYQPLSRGHLTSVDEMNEEIIAKHNEKVAFDDTCYFLGDLAFGGSKKLLPLLRRMNGIKHYVMGNHCGCFKSSSIRAEFETVQKYLEVRVNDTFVIMFHFPIRHWNLEENGSVHFFGHLHSDIPAQYGKSFEVCIDGNNLYPYHLPTLIDEVNEEQVIGRPDREAQENLGPDEMIKLHGKLV